MRIQRWSLIYLVAVANATAADNERVEDLRSVVRSANRIVVEYMLFGLSAEGSPQLELNGRGKIAELLALLEFDEANSGDSCACLGDSWVAFYHDDQPLARLSHHHGISLRWDAGPWDGDSIFTEKSAKAWRDWFEANGEPLFANKHRERIQEAERRARIDTAFFAALPPGAKIIEDQYGVESTLSSLRDSEEQESPLISKFAALFANRADMALAIANALGSLATHDNYSGSWNSRPPREALVLDCAKALAPAEFEVVLTSNDPTALLGAARLFFAEGLVKLATGDQRSAIAARLVEVVIKHDKAGNSDSALRWLVRFPCSEAAELLSRLASGKIIAAASDPLSREPSTRAAACIMLAKLEPANAMPIIAKLETEKSLSELDRAALRVARSLAGEKGMLDSSIFEIASFAIGVGALHALEEEGGDAALDAIIQGGTQHMWAAIREEAVLTAERMTGKKWLQGKENERAEWHGEAIREWWAANGRTIKD